MRASKAAASDGSLVPRGTAGAAEGGYITVDEAEIRAEGVESALISVQRIVNLLAFNATKGITPALQVRAFSLITGHLLVRSDTHQSGRVAWLSAPCPQQAAVLMLQGMLAWYCTCWGDASKLALASYVPPPSQHSAATHATCSGICNCQAYATLMGPVGQAVFIQGVTCRLAIVGHAQFDLLTVADLQVAS